MAFDYINEAFKRLDVLEEDIFKTSTDGISALTDFVENDDEEVIDIIDPEASSTEELQDSYVGKVIVNCNVCHSHIFENKDEITIEEDGAVNIEQTCPYCGESEGFVIIGEIAPYSETTQPDEEPKSEEPVVDSDVDVQTDIEETSEETNESCSRATKRAMREDFKEVSIKTEDQKLEMTSDENGKVTVTTEPIEAEVTEETIVPISDETTEEILSNNEVEDEFNFEEDDFTTEEATEEDNSEDAPIFEESLQSEKDIDFDDIDEDSLNTVSEKYLKHVYENVESFKTTDVSCTPSQMIVEGIIRFNSGAEKKTGFIFEAKDVNSRGQVRFTGSNKHLTESANAFTLVASVDNNKLFTESLKYQYSVNDQPVRGVARRK